MEVRRVTLLAYLPQLPHLSRPNIWLSIKVVLSNVKLLGALMFEIEVFQY